MTIIRLTPTILCLIFFLLFFLCYCSFGTSSSLSHSSFLQSVSAGHVSVFDTSSIYIASPDHSLHGSLPEASEYSPTLETNSVGDGKGVQQHCTTPIQQSNLKKIPSFILKVTKILTFQLYTFFTFYYLNLSMA